MDATTGTTRYCVDDVRAMDGKNSVQDLVLSGSGEHIADRFIRPYAICRTPSFLRTTTLVGWDGEFADELFGLVEGAERERLVRHRQRERRLRDKKIRTTLEATGSLRCEVPDCGFDFRVTYGELGDRFAHVHHRDSLAERREGVTSLADLAIVCANCHAMIHRDGKCRSLEEVRPQRRSA